MADEYSDYVDIGGECFNTTGAKMEPTPKNRSYDLVCKSKKKFESTFKNILKENGDLELLQKFLPYQKPQLLGMGPNDKKRLTQIIRARMADLQSSLQHNNRTVQSMQFERYHENLSKLLQDIKNADGGPSVTPISAVRDRVKKLSKEKIFYLLLEMAWYLLHPEKIRKSGDSWNTILDQIEQINLGEMVEYIHKTNPTRYTTRIDMDRVEKANDGIGDALSLPDDVEELKRRLQAILTILQTKKYLSQVKSDKKGPVNPDGLDRVLPESMTYPITGGALTKKANDVKPLYPAMLPFYDYFLKRYDPITSVLAGIDYKEKVSLPSLAQLLYVCEQVNNTQGIYKLTNLDQRVYDFIKAHLLGMKTYLSNKTDEEKADFDTAATVLPKISITTFMNKYGKKGNYTDPDKIPSLQFMMMGVNLESHSDKSKMTTSITDDVQRGLIYDAAKAFFTDDALYLVCTDSKSTKENIPMKLFEIDDNTVDVSKKQSLVPISDNFFNKNPKQADLHLEKIMKISPEILYHHGMLALSIFMASKELLSK